MKIGIWTKTQIEYETEIGKKIATEFIEYEKSRETRRKEPRKALMLDLKEFPLREKKDFSKLQFREKNK
jgi:hypothetical protein